MRALKVFLSFVLILCAFWFFLVFFGSSLVKQFVQVYLGEHVKLHNVKVSPQLDVMIERVDFMFPTSADSNEVAGSSRAVNFKLHALLAKPLMTITLGRTKLSKSAGFKKASISLSPPNLFNWDESIISIKSEHLLVEEILEVQDFNLIGNLSFDLDKIYDIEIDLKDINLFDGRYLNTNLARATLDQIYFNLRLDQQFNDFEIFSELIEADFEQVSAANVSARIQNRNGKVDADLFSGSVNSAKYSIRGEKIHAHANFLNASNALSGPVTLQAKKVFSAEGGWEFSDAYGQISTVGTGNELDLKAVINELELKNGKQYIGKIEDGFVELNIKLSPWGPGLSDDLSGVLIVGSSSDFLAQISAQAAIDDESNVFQCLEKKCEFSSLSAKYLVSAGDNKLNGLLECPNGNCFSASASHEVTTINTELFFKKLMQIGIFNPLVVSFIYTEIRSGVPIEAGHIVNLN